MAVARPRTLPPPSPLAAVAPVPQLGQRRPGPRLAMAGLLVVLAALGAVVLYQGAIARPAVLAVARPVPYGQVLVPEDVRVVHLAGSGVTTIAAGRLQEVVGQRARAALTPGMVLTASHLSTGPLVGAGDAVASAAVRSGALPPGLRGGDRVRVVRLPGGGTGALADPRPLPLATGTVLAVVADRDGSSTTTVSLIVPTDVADAVSAAGAVGQISLVLLVGAS